jgi:hypothetical protein
MKLKEQKRAKFEIDVTASAKFTKASSEQVSTMRQARASNEVLKSLLPNVDEDKNPDIYAISFDAAVANLINANGDGVLTPTAKLLAPSFVNKPINVEHNKSWVVGFVSTYGFSSFAEKELITDIGDDNRTPFNICLGGVIWKHVDPYFAEMVEDSTKKTSWYYQKVSASWEVGFDEYYIALGSKNLAEAEIVMDDARCEELEKHLESEGGTGFTKDGVPVYRVLTGECVAHGIGLTMTPAAAVKGITMASKEIDEKISDLGSEIKELKASLEVFAKESQENIKNISQLTQTNVKKNRIMKIKDISDITEDTLKESTASDLRDGVRDLIANSLKEADEKFKKEKAEADQVLETQKAEATSLKEKGTQLENEVLTLKNEIATMKAEVEAKAKADLFTKNLASVKEQFNLDEASEAIVSSKIKDLDEEGFKTWLAEAKVLFKGLAKEPGNALTKVVASAQVGKSDLPNGNGGNDREALVARAKSAFKVTHKDGKIVLE